MLAWPVVVQRPKLGPVEDCRRRGPTQAATLFFYLNTIIIIIINKSNKADTTNAIYAQKARGTTTCPKHQFSASQTRLVPIGDVPWPARPVMCARVWAATTAHWAGWPDINSKGRPSNGQPLTVDQATNRQQPNMHTTHLFPPNPYPPLIFSPRP